MQETILSLENVTLYYNNKKALDNISFSIKEGEIVTLIGPNGGGKTSCAKLVLGLENPSIGKVNRSNKIKNIGYMPQKIKFNSFMPITVKYFLSLQSKNTHLYHDFNITPLLNSQIHHLSGGELQRVMLVSALLTNPDLLVLDEPTQGLDVQGQADFYKLLDIIRSTRKITILIISHDLYTVMRSTDYVICLNQHVCCEGSAENISSDPSFISLFGDNSIKSIGMYSHHHNHSH